MSTAAATQKTIAATPTATERAEVNSIAGSAAESHMDHSFRSGARTPDAKFRD
jgi:hypothetical protein